MNVGLRRKVSMLAMLVGVFASLATLQANDAPVAKKKSKVAAAQSNHKKLSPFEDAQKRLKAQVKKVKDPKAQKLLQNVIKNADQVQKAGVKVTPGAVAKALVSIQEVTNYISNQKIGAKHSKSSSSSSKSCNECKLLHEIRKEIEECCQNLASELEEIENFLETQFPCNAPIAIDHVPFVISQSGKYCVTTDLVYTGSGTAIAVTVDNVTINFADHNLTLTVDGAQGIHAENVSEFVLEDDRIQGTSLFTSPTSAAVSLVNVNKATLKNIYTLNTTDGIQITGCTDVTVKNSLLRFHYGHGVFIDGSTGVTIDSSTLAGADIPASSPATSEGLFTQNNTQNVTIKDSTLTGWLITINAHQVTGLLIDRCLAIASTLTNYNILQLGFDPTNQANDVTIRNSNFMQPVLVPGCDGLLFINGTGCVLENVIVDTTTTTDNTGYIPAAIHIGCAANGGCDPTLSYNNVLAINCIVRGANQYGLYIESGSKVTFDQSQFTDASLANIWMQEAINSIIKDSSVTNGTGTATGILIDDGSNNNAVINCDVSTNGGDGIKIISGALFNHLRGNSVFDNTGTGINNLSGTNSETFFNTSCHNGTDCFGVSPEQLAGAPAVAGSNVCCDFVP